MAKKISTEALAEMVEKGFDQLSEEMRELRKDVESLPPLRRAKRS